MTAIGAGVPSLPNSYATRFPTIDGLSKAAIVAHVLDPIFTPMLTGREQTRLEAMGYVPSPNLWFYGGQATDFVTDQNQHVNVQDIPTYMYPRLPGQGLPSGDLNK